MDIHLLWLWLWFLLGMAVYWLKRAYFLVTGPNPIANNYSQFIDRCWIPLLVRAFIDSMVYWIMFTPHMASGILNYFGWTGYETSVELVTQVPPVAALFGLAIDSVVDFAVTKIPYVKDFLPQMPPPLPQQAVVQAQMIETSQKVTQLATTTTVIQAPKEG